MKPLTLPVVKNLLKSICLNTQNLEVKELIGKSIFWMNNYGSFALNVKKKKEYYAIAKFLRFEYNQNKLTKEVANIDIENFLLEFISRVIILSSKKEKLDAIDNFENELKKYMQDKIENHEIIFPILGLKTNSNFSFGNISFYPFTKYQLKKEMKFIKSLFIKNKLIKEKEKKEWIIVLKKELSIYLNQSMFKCNIVGTNTAAKLKSYNTALLHINVLKLLVYDIANNKPKYNTPKNEIQYHETLIKTNNAFRIIDYLPVEFNIDLKNLNFLKTKKSKLLSEILKKDLKDEIDNRILASINWAINSIEKTPNVSEKADFFESSVYMTPTKYVLTQCLLNMIIAFETLLLFDDERNKLDLLRYRSLSLLEKTEYSDLFIIEQIIDSYKRRSDIVHEGKFINSPKIVFQLYLFFRDIVFELLTLKNKEKIITNDQLKKWFSMKENLIKYNESKSKYYETPQ